MTISDAPTLALRRLMRQLRATDGKMRRQAWMPWQESVIEAGIRRGLLEATEHGKYRGKHRVVAVRITDKGRTWPELHYVARAAASSEKKEERPHD